VASPPWLRNLSRAFKAHRLGRTGWYLEEHRERLRVVSAELPPRPGEPPEAVAARRAFTLQTPPGPATSAAALAEACGIFDAVMTGTWSWPDPEATPAADDPGHLSPVTLERLTAQLRARLVGEQMGSVTWDRTWRPYLAKLAATAGERHWLDDAALLGGCLRNWEPNSRARQMAYDRARRLWKEAGWAWPEELQPLRGNGKAAADPRGVRAFTDGEIAALRETMQRSKLTPADLVAWDCLICFGLRPKELQELVLELRQCDGALALVAVVGRSKRSSKGSSGARTVVAVPPAGWPRDCFDLLGRWREHGLPAGLLAMRSPGELLSRQLRRLHQPTGLTAYGLRHAFALRLGVELGLSVREAAEIMGHSPAVHLSTYGRRLDAPKLQDKLAALVNARADA
jgi:integrase